MKQVILVYTENKSLKQQLKRLSAQLSRKLQFFFAETPKEVIEYTATLKVQEIIYQAPLPCSEMLKIVETIRDLREVPILALIDSQDTDDLEFCLNIVEDFVRLPLDESEFIARSRALLHHSERPVRHIHQEKQFIAIKGIIIHKNTKRVFVKTHEVELTNTELRILLLLVNNPNLIFSRSHIYSSVWDDENGTNVDGLVKEHIRKLRKAIGKYIDSEVIENIRGIGYRISSGSYEQLSFADL